MRDETFRGVVARMKDVLNFYKGERIHRLLVSRRRRSTATLTSLDDFLSAEGIVDEVTERAEKRVRAMQLEQAKISH